MKPFRRWRKIAGPFELNRINSAIISRNGELKISSAEAAERSKARLSI
jgi:hypothetical protein